MNPIHQLPISEADARIFVTVVDAGSFTAAAALHGLTTSAVSKAMSRLEAALGVRLLVRTTRSLRVTDEGGVFHERCAQAFRMLAEAAEEAAASTRSISGTLRIGLPPIFGTYLVAPRLAPFLERHPKLRIEMATLSGLADFIAAGVDCAIAVGELPDSSFVARPLGRGLFVTVAAPSYLQREGMPATIEALKRHRRIGFVRTDGRENPWLFNAEDGLLQFEVNGQVRSDEMHHLAAAAVAGLGIAQLPLFIVDPEIAAGRLMRVLEGCEPPPRLASLVHPAGRALPRRVRAFVDYLLASDAVPAGVSR